MKKLVQQRSDKSLQTVTIVKLHCGMLDQLCPFPVTTQGQENAKTYFVGTCKEINDKLTKEDAINAFLAMEYKYDNYQVIAYLT